MKFFFALLGVALAAHSSLPIGQSLPSRTEFRFRYEGSLLSGLPLPTTENSLTRIQADVLLQTVDDRTALFQINTFKVAASHSMDSEKFVSLDVLEQRELAREHEVLLQLPVKFTYKHGLVSDLVFTSEELTWSANIKRSIINMLQLNLNKVGVEETTKFEVESTKLNDFFSVFEKTIEGDCEVAYTILSEEDKTVVTKAVNFEKCSRRSDIRYHLRFASECTECDKTKVVIPQTVYNFVLEKDLLKESEVRSIYTVTLKDESVMKTEVRARLTLVETREIVNRIEIPRGEKEELIYSTEWEELVEKFFKQGDHIKVATFIDFEEKVQLLKELLRETSLLKENKPETVHIFARIVELMRMCSKVELNRIIDEVYLVSEDKIMHIIEHALAVAGTKNTIEQLIVLIERETIIPTKAALLFKFIQETSYPSEHIMKLVHHFLVSDVCRRSPVLEQSAWLVYGSLMRGVVNPVMESHLIKENTLTFKNKFVHIMKKQLESANTIYEKILVIKTLANAAVDVSIPVLERIILNKKEETVVRMEAIDALRLFNEQMPRKIQRLLMPVFSDRLEVPELRMSALVQLLKSQPRLAVLSQIVIRMERESNKHVAAFTYHMMKTLSTSTVPCHRVLSSDITLLLQVSRFQPEEKILSIFLSMPMYSEYLISGANINLASIFGRQSVLPKHLMTSLETVLLGTWNKDLLQVGLSQQNIEKMFTIIMHKLNKFEKEQTMVRGRRVQQSISMLKTLARKMNIRIRENLSEEPHLMLYLRYKQMDYAVLPINEHILDRMIEKFLVGGRFDGIMLEKLFDMEPEFDFTHAAFFLEATSKIPTTMGLPLTISAKIPTVTSAKGKFSLERVPFGVSVRLQTTPTIASTMLYQMRLWTPLFEHGVKLIRTAELNLPIDVNVDVVYKKDLEISLRQIVPLKETRLVHLTTRPVAFFRFPISVNVHKYVEAEEKTIVLPTWEKMNKNIEHTYTFLGLNMLVRGNDFNQWTLKNIVLGEQVLELTCEPINRRMTEISTRLVIESVRSGVIEKPQVEKMFDDEFEMNDYDYELRDEKIRREHVHKMIRDKTEKIGFLHRMTLLVETAEKKTEVELRTECEKNLRFCRMILESSMPTMFNEDRVWTLKSLLEVVMPETVSTWKDLKEQKHREIQILFENKWGSEEMNTMSVKMQLEQNKEQREWIKLANKEMRGVQSFDLLTEAARLNQLKAVVDYDLTTYNTVFFNRVFDMLKTYTFWQNKLERIDSQTRKVLILLTAEPTTHRLANLTIQTPTERFLLRNIDVPVVLPTLVSNYDNKLINTIYQKSECEVKTSKINTFDNVIYRVPITTCYSVIAKDCSEEPRFAVLVKKINRNGEEKKVKLIKDDIVYEMELVDGELILTVDNKIIRVRDFETYNVEMLNDNLFHINLDGLMVRFDGYTVKVVLSGENKFKQCGLCGNFDGEKKNDFRNVYDEETDSLEEFHRSFIVKHEDCSMDETLLSEKKNYKLWEMNNYEDDYTVDSKLIKNVNTDRLFETEDVEEYYTDKIEPVEKTRVIEFSHRVCFSMEPILECPRNLMAGRAIEKKVRFTCMPRHVPEARRLLASARKEVVVINHLPVSFVENILVPQTCEVY